MPIGDFLVWLSSITQSQTKKACTVGVADVVVNDSRQPSTAVPPRASNTSPKRVWVEPTRQK
jgi:hypothetical protein